MTIHHDKLAYGKLAKTSEELSEEEILKMLSELNKDKKEDSSKDDNSDKNEQK